MFPNLTRFFKKTAANPKRIEEIFLVVNDKILPLDNMIFTPKKKSEIYLCPVIGGSGNTGWGIASALLGVVLIIVGVVFQQYYLIGPGISLIFSGVVIALTPEPPKLKTGDDTQARRNNFFFEGLVNSTDQSNPVALHYGNVRIAGQLLSGSIVTIDESISYTGSKGEQINQILSGGKG
jgi:predicted phage tail protein